uniref:Uncharacterized protein n=1 Tax=Arundo donax TaxID=35708 RepID=A0A0A9BB51_ARUDO
MGGYDDSEITGRDQLARDVTLWISQQESVFMMFSVCRAFCGLASGCFTLSTVVTNSIQFLF